MIVYAFLVLACVMFVELFVRLHVLKHANAVMQIAKQSIDVLSSSTLNDEEKEAFFRKNSFAMLAATFNVVLKLGIIVLALYAAFRLLIAAFPETERTVMDSVYSLTTAVAMTFVALAYVWIKNVVSRRL